MSTQITINVSGNRLLQQSREAQAANRQQLTQKEVDDKFLADVRQIEAAALQREGAVPEYRIQEQTSAQRGGINFGMGWLYESYEDSFQHPYATQAEKYRIAVGSGDGKEWAYQDLELPIPDLSGFQLTSVNGYRRTGFQPVDTISFTSFDITSIPPGQDACLGNRTWNVDRSSLWVESYSKQRRNVYFTAPVGGQDGCVLIGSAFIYNYIQKTHAEVARAVEVLTGDVESVFTNGSGYRFLKSVTKTGTDPNTGLPISFNCFWEMPFSNTSGLGVGQSLNQYGPDGRETFAWVYQYGTVDNPQVFEPPANTYAHNEVVRVNYAFYVSPTKCRKLEVPAELAALLEERFPTPSWQPLFNDEPWQSVDTNAPGYGYLEEVGGFAEFNFGTPPVYTAIKNDLDFEPYKSTEFTKDPFNRRSSMAAPDFTSGRYVDGVFRDSTFNFDQQVNLDSFVYYPADDPDDYSQPSTLMRMSEYTYLTNAVREASAYYEFSNYKTIIDRIPADPEFWISYKPSSPNGIALNNETDFPTWLPEGTYRTKAAIFKLSPDRVLPPALYQQEDHPLVRPVPVPVRHIFTGGPISSGPYSFFPFITLLWTSFEGSFASQLGKLGFTPADLRP